jgi:UPF0042 nucleotide-binding protein
MSPIRLISKPARESNRGVQFDAIIDCRVLSNPHHQISLRAMTGMDDRVQAFIQKDPMVNEVMTTAINAVADGAQTIAFVCFGGRHRSVAIAEFVYRAVRQNGLSAVVEHWGLQ